MEKKLQSTTEKSDLVPDRLTQVCRESKDRLAAQFGDTSLSYKDLELQSDRLAASLAMNGTGSGDLIGIGMERSHNMLIAILGVWKTGAAFLPIDSGYPEQRLKQMLEDAAPKIVITDEASIDRLQFSNSKILNFDDIAKEQVKAAPTVSIAADTIAYVIFTSGSTGRPKAVRISHGALANFLAGIQQVLQMQPSDTLLALTTLSFDISVLELILPLVQGATTVIAEQSIVGDGKRLAAAIDECRPSFMQATPTTWRLLLDAGWSGSNDLSIICGGENLGRALAEDLLQRCSRLFNVYGPTEATIRATLEDVRSGVGPVPIGLALDNYQALVLDEDLGNATPGNIGQLFLGGASLATDYLNRPDETCRQFIDHPEHGRLYATGDLVREVADGKLEFAGRIDDQVKIRGFRVEMGDIEAHLVEVPGVKEALVALREDTSGVKKLVAYVVSDGTIEITTGTLRKALLERLPDYMIPHHFIALASFPKTFNNKIDRAKLPRPEITSDNDLTPIEDPFETQLQSIWVDVLGVASIGPADDFFDLGGDSILAARITNRIEDWLGEVVWPVVLFDAPTIAELANYLRASYPESTSSKTPDATQGVADHLIDQKMIEEFDALIKPLVPFPPPVKKNRQAIFVLNPPRSGSTLLRVMMAGHPRIFAPPEIELLTFNTMHERLDVFSGREKYRLEGTIRAVMELKNCDVEEAQSIIGTSEKAQTSVADFYGIMQSWLDGRILVDKTPANTLDPAALHRIEEYFEDPIYIHLTRHPLGMIRSFLEAKLSTVFFRRASHRFSPRELAELIWLTSHRNILATLSNVPAARQFRLSFESLTHAPEDAMHQLCNMLDIEYQPAMVKPWENKTGKMTDGLHPESKMMGDPKFHQHKTIDPGAADRWQAEMQGAVLGDATRALAEELGYSLFGAATQSTEREEFIL